MYLTVYEALESYNPHATWHPIDTQIDDDFFPFRNAETEEVIVLRLFRDIEGTEYYEIMFDK